MREMQIEACSNGFVYTCKDEYGLSFRGVAITLEELLQAVFKHYWGSEPSKCNVGSTCTILIDRGGKEPT